MENMLEVCESITHTSDINQVQVPKTPERESGRADHSRGNYHPQQGFSHHSHEMGLHVDASNIPTCANSNFPMNTELLHMVRKQEMAWENAEAAVHKLERRLRILERSDSMNKSPLHVIQDNVSAFAQFPCDIQAGFPAPAAPYSCIYVSPIYDDKKGSIMYRTHIVEDGGYGPQNRPFSERFRDDEKEIEIKRLKLELQRQDLEMRRLKADVHRLRSLEFEDDKNIISDKFVDKVNTVRMTSSSMSRPRSYHDALQYAKADLNTSFSSTETSAENSKGLTYSGFVDGQGLSGSHCGTPRRSNLGSQGPFKSMRENLVAGRREYVMAPAAVPDLDRCPLSPDCSNSSFMLRQMITSLLSTMQLSVENLCNNIKMREPRDSDSSRIDSGAIDDELFILKKSLSKLGDMCNESGYESFSCETRNNQVEADKLANLQATIDGMLQQLAQAEFKILALESSCVDKEKKVEDLESQIHGILREREALMVEKYELTNVVREMQQEAEEQRHRIEELLSINEELLEISQAEEDTLGTFQETKDRLMQQVVQYEDNCANFESLLIEKEKELEDVNRKLKAGQIGADSIIFEKFELLGKIQAMQVQADEQRNRIDELVSINEELLEFAQSKEDQIAYMSKEVDRLKAHCGETAGGSIPVERNQEESRTYI